MSPKIPLCGDCFAAGQYVCFAICNPDMARAAIQQGKTHADLVRALDGVRPLHNIIMKECCHHIILLHWGRMGLGNRKKVPDCIANAFRVVFPSPDGNYMGHHDSYSTSPLCRDEQSSDTSSETQLQEEDNVIVEIDVPLSEDEEELVKERSDTSSETRIQEEDNVIVEIDAPLFADEEELVVPETEETVFVVVPETQETVVVVDLLSHEVVDHHPHRDPFKYGGFYYPTFSEGDNYSSYSQFHSKFAEHFSKHDGHTCLHCGRGMATERCPNCTDEGQENTRKCGDANGAKVDTSLKVTHTF
jgi:hypothetical protein